MSSFLTENKFVSITKTNQVMLFNHVIRIRCEKSYVKGKRSSLPYNLPRRPRGGIEVWLYSFFNLCARWGWVINVTRRGLHSTERGPMPIVKEAGCPRAGLNGCGKSQHHRLSIPGPSSPRRVAILTALSRSTKSYVGQTHN
jgi:hypothetical protein